jgi:aspartyl protease family protein
MVGCVMALACAATPMGHAQSVAMTGRMGGRALLVISGGAPKALAVGEVYQGVTVISVGPDQAVLEVAGQRQTVSLGGAPVSVAGKGGGQASGTQIVLTAGSGGHFNTAGQINGRATTFMVDTGATSIAMGEDEARRLGINYESGSRIRGNTANGDVVAYKVSLSSVRIQDVEVHNVEAAVLPMAMGHILLGNSFLTRFQMKRDNDVMTLTRRY